MKKIFLLLLMILTVSGCGSDTQNKPPAEPEKVESADKTPVPPNILVVYFSRTGEEYNVGRITKGNTAIVAEFIAQKVGADIFEIKPETPYPDEYELCTEIAKQELESNVRPELANNIENLAQYDTIFLGYPIWWSDLPMIVYTFLESGDFSGKTIIPFCTSAGDYMTGKETAIPNHATGATIREGLGLKGKRCQEEPAAVKKDVDAWLTGLGY